MSNIHFFISVPPEQPKIHDETGKERKNLVGPYTEGSSLTLTCHVRGGKNESLVYIDVRSITYKACVKGRK